MKLTQTQIVGILVGFAILAGAVWAYSKWKSNQNKDSEESAYNANSQDSEESAYNANSQDKIPDAVQAELKYHDEGETLSYQGSKYQVVGGQWFKI